MKTNNKLHPVFSYIIDSIEFEGSNVEKLQSVLIAFNEEYNNDYNKKISPNLQNRFAEWLKGLPSCIDIAFYNSDILELARRWESLPDIATERQENLVIANWFNFISVKFFQLCKQNKINYSYTY